MRRGPCARSRCTRRAGSGQLCDQHFQDAKKRGDAGCVAADEVQAHIEALRGHSMTADEIAADAGVSRHTVSRIHGRKSVRAVIARRLLSVEPRVGSSRMPAVNPSGVYRRMRAARCLGWGPTDFAAESGLPFPVVKNAAAEVKCSTRTAVLIVAAYERLLERPLPTGRQAKVNVAFARNRGWIPPEGWGDIDHDEHPLPLESDIVDEVAVQRVVDGLADATTLTEAEKKHAAKRLRAAGETRNGTASRLRMSMWSVDKASKEAA